MAAKIPTTVFTGFLGSGKTTIIGHLLDELAARGQKVAYLKNEIGEEDLDTKLLQGNNIATRELLNGCICCTLVGPFMAAIDELADTYQLDRIIIETAGTADPASMAVSVSQHPRLQRDGVISIIDVVNFQGYEDLSQVARRQAQLTDLIVFNKVELVDEERKRAVVGYVREINETAPIVEAPKGKLASEVAFGLGVGELDALLKQQSHEHHHEHQDAITAFTLVNQQIFSRQQLETFVSQLPKQVIRVKGAVQTDQGWLVMNAVYRRVTFQSVPETLQPVENRLIVIGYQVEQLHDQLVSLLMKANGDGVQ